MLVFTFSLLFYPNQWVDNVGVCMHESCAFDLVFLKVFVIDFQR